MSVILLLLFIVGAKAVVGVWFGVDHSLILNGFAIHMSAMNMRYDLIPHFDPMSS